MMTGEILTWLIGGMAFFLLAFLFLSLISAVEEMLAWVKRRWL